MATAQTGHCPVGRVVRKCLQSIPILLYYVSNLVAAAREVKPVPEGVYNLIAKPAGQSLSVLAGRGKSGLHRAGCRLTAGRREAMESGTENTPPMARKGSGKGEKVR